MPGLRDDDRQPGLAPDGQGLVERTVRFLGVAAHVGGVDAAVTGRHGRQRDDLGGLAETRRRVFQPGREPGGAGIHGLTDPGRHGGDLVGRCRALGIVHGRHAQGAVADQQGGVAGRRGALEQIDVGRKGRVTVTGVVTDQVERFGRRFGHHQRRQADAAVARDHGRHPLADLGRHVAGIAQHAVVMGVHVDETGRDDAARGIDHRLRNRLGEIADGHDPVVVDGDVGAIAQPARAVDDLAAADDDAVFLHGCLPCRA